MSEMAIVSSRRSRLKNLIAKKHRGAKTALKLLEGDGEFLASIQIGITLIGVLAGAVSGATLADKLAVHVGALHPLLEPYSHGLSFGLVVVLVTYLSLILGELVPKKMALNNPEIVASRMAKLVSLTGYTLRPMVYILTVSTNTVLKVMRVPPVNDKVVTEEEVKILIADGAKVGIFDKQEEAMIRGVLRLDDHTVGELMTPRTQVVGVDINDTNENILKKMTQHNHSHFPVFDSSIDQPVGVLSVKTVLAKFVQNKVITVSELMSSPLFLPESMTTDVALQKFRNSGLRLGFAIDEYGGFAGVLTVYDITEAIIGEMPEGGRQKMQNRKIVKRHDGSWLVEGYILIDELLETLKLPPVANKENFQTVGGYMMTKLGKIPKEGDIVKHENFQFEVMDMDKHRVDKVLVTKMVN